MASIPITSDEYLAHRDNYDGLCVSCLEWTEGEVEPDARKYTCPYCDEQAVYGAEEALMEGFITIDDD